MVNFSRRTILRGAASLAALSTFPRPALAQSGPIRIAALNSLSGPLAYAGKFGDMGSRLALLETPKVLGRSVEYLSLDEESNPGRGVRRVQEAIQNGNRFFVGGALSSTALAVMKEVDARGGVYTTMTGADEITGTECNKSTFRWSVPTYGAIQQTVLPLIEKFPDAKRWYTITPQYVFGESLLAAAEDIFKEKGIEHVGNSFHSLQESEFSGYLANAMAQKPDVLLILSFAGQSNNTLRTAVNFGMKSGTKILLAWSGGMQQVKELGADVMEGIYFGSQYWHTVDNPENRALIELCKKHNGINPDMLVAGHYSCAKLLLQAMEKSNSDDPQAVRQTLSGFAYKGVTGDEEIRAFDHQVLKDYYLLQGKPKSKMQDEDDVAELLSFGKSFVGQENSACKMSN